MASRSSDAIRGLDVRLQVPTDISQRVVIFGEDHDAVAVPAGPLAEPRGVGSSMLPLDVLEKLLELLIRLNGGPGRQLSSISVEELHLPGEVGMIGVAECGQRGLLGLALGLSGRGDLPGGVDSVVEMRGRLVSMTSSASSSASRPRCRWRDSACSSSSISVCPCQSAVSVELLLDRLVVLVQRAPERFHRGEEPLLEPGLEEGRSITDFERLIAQPFLAKGAVVFQLGGELEFRRPLDRGRDTYGFDLPLREGDPELSRGLPSVGR